SGKSALHPLCRPVPERRCGGPRSTLRFGVMFVRSRSMLLALGLWFLLIPCGLARAQINAESLAEAVKEPGWGGAAKGSLALFRGNVDLLELSGEAALRFATAHPDAQEREKFLFRDRVLVYGSASMRDVSGETVVNNG